MEQKKWKNKNFLVAFKHSLEGIKKAFQMERNLKIQIVAAICAILLGIFLKLTGIEWGILFLTIAMVLSTELINTAIEVALDLYSEEYNDTIKQAKDIASGAVLVAAIVSVVIGVILFLPKILNY